MNKNATPLILIVLAIGIYFTFTRNKFEELKAVKVVNTQYREALDNSEKLIKVRDSVLATYNKITPEDQENLEKMLPDNVDNVRLIIDINGVASRHGLLIKNVKTTTPKDMNTPVPGDTDAPQTANTYNTVTLGFDVNGNYQAFVNFLKDLEASMRIIEISKISLKSSDISSSYDYSVEVKTYWLKQ